MQSGGTSHNSGEGWLYFFETPARPAFKAGFLLYKLSKARNRRAGTYKHHPSENLNKLKRDLL